MSSVLSFINFLATINEAIGRMAVRISSILVALMTVFVLAGVFCRYVLNDALSWVEDVALIMMVSVAFIIAPYAYRIGANVSIDVVIASLPKRAIRVLRLIINMLILWIIYRYFLESLNLVNRGWGIRVNTVPISWAWPYMIVPVSFVAMALACFELLARDCYGLVTGSTEGDLSPPPTVEVE